MIFSDQSNNQKYNASQESWSNHWEDDDHRVAVVFEEPRKSDFTSDIKTISICLAQ